jgi:hypothetical protein
MGMMFRNEDEMRLAALKGAILCDSDLTDVQPQPADIDRMESLMAAYNIGLRSREAAEAERDH